MSQRSRMPPPGASRRTRNRIPDDDDDEMEITQRSRASRGTGRRARQNISASQPGPSSRHDFDDTNSQTLSQSGGGTKSTLPLEEENHLVSSVIRYLLVADRPKHLIQKANIVKNAMPSHGKHFKVIITRVKDSLRELFGYNLVELEGGKFILTNNMENNDLHLQFSASEKSDLVLLLITLGHLFMLDEGSCTEDELFDLFRKLDIVEGNDFVHDYFGDVKHLITEKFVKQGYLELVTVERSDPPLQHYQWGPRAEHELRPRSVLEFMSKIFGGRPLNTWPAQFQTMMARETSDSLS